MRRPEGTGRASQRVSRGILAVAGNPAPAALAAARPHTHTLARQVPSLPVWFRDRESPELFVSVGVLPADDGEQNLGAQDFSWGRDQNVLR